MVFALAGDSTSTKFMEAIDKMPFSGVWEPRPAAESPGTWVMQPRLSNRYRSQAAPRWRWNRAGEGRQRSLRWRSLSLSFVDFIALVYAAGRPDSRHKEAEPVEKRAARMAVRRHAVAELQLADVVAQVEIEMPVEIGDLVTEACQLFLQRDALGAGRLDIVDRPSAAEPARAAQPVGEMRDRERIGIRIVVRFEHDKILRH